jgi:hypothetical protein
MKRFINTSSDGVSMHHRKRIIAMLAAEVAAAEATQAAKQAATQAAAVGQVPPKAATPEVPAPEQAEVPELVFANETQLPGLAACMFTLHTRLTRIPPSSLMPC